MRSGNRRFGKLMFDGGHLRGSRNELLPLRVKALCVDVDGAAILRNLSFELVRDGCTVIMGPNGAGKTQLLKAIHGLISPSSGTIDWNGQGPAAARFAQSLVFQKPILLRRSVAANVAFVLKARGRARHELHGLLEIVGLADKARQPARLLSGGEAQRLALARALAVHPKVLLLDEPTANLDPAATQQIEQIVTDVAAQGVKVIFITHDIGQARRLADDVVFLHHGQVVASGAAPAFWNAPPCKAVQDFLAGRIVE